MTPPGGFIMKPGFIDCMKGLYKLLGFIGLFLLPWWRYPLLASTWPCAGHPFPAQPEDFWLFTCMCVNVYACICAHMIILTCESLYDVHLCVCTCAAYMDTTMCDLRAFLVRLVSGCLAISFLYISGFMLLSLLNCMARLQHADALREVQSASICPLHCAAGGGLESRSHWSPARAMLGRLPTIRAQANVLWGRLRGVDGGGRCGLWHNRPKSPRGSWG